MRQVIIYATLLIALLLGAWARWTADPTPDADGKVVLLAGDADQIDSIVWKSDDDSATVTSKTDEHGSYLWVRTVKWDQRRVPPTPAAQAGDRDKDGGPLPPTDVQGTTERIERKSVFKAGVKGGDLLADFSPLYALRRFDNIDADKLSAFGLDEPKESIALTRRGTTTTLSIGGEAYGTKDRYVQDQGTGHVYLVDDQLLKTLQYAKTRLPDRSLFSIERAKVQSATIQSQMADHPASIDARQLNSDDVKKASWVRADAAEGEVDEQLTTWLDKALKLKGTTYVDPDADDGPADLQPRFSLTLQPQGKDLPETLEVLQDGPKGDYYGRSEHTRGLLKLLRSPTRAVVDDIVALTD